jgi:hypothetical protein
MSIFGGPGTGFYGSVGECCRLIQALLSIFFLSKSRLAVDMEPINVKDSVIQQVNVIGRDQINFNYNCKKKQGGLRAGVHYTGSKKFIKVTDPPSPPK